MVGGRIAVPAVLASAGQRLLLFLRMLGIGLLAAVVAGSFAGVAARAIMRIAALTDAEPGVGGFSLRNTLVLILDAVILYHSLPAALLFVAIRRYLPGTAWRQGLAFGAFLLLPATPALFLTTDDRLIQLLFGALCLSYGVVLAHVVGWLDAHLARPRR